MKRKLLLLLCACLLMGGCGNGSTAQNNGSAYFSEESAEKTGTEVNGAGDSQTDASASGAEGVQPIGQESNQEENNQEESNQGEITPVSIANDYEQAAYFADRIYAVNGGNTIVSPLSLNIALGLAAQGASGETAKELYAYLGSERYTDWVDTYMTFAEGLYTDGSNDAKYSFSYKLANSVWVNQNETLDPNYQKLVQEKFRAQAQNVDFAGHADETAKKINAWCDEHTEGLIKKMVEPDMLSADLMAILMNSVYFESPWKKSWRVEEHAFQNLKGESTTQEMLFDTVSAYYENAHATAFAKDYYNGFQFIGILPKSEGDFCLSDLDLKSLLASANYDMDVKAIMPRLAFETSTKSKNINAILQAQGVHLAFDPENAEFHDMVVDQPLYIDDILQKCRIELDEEGTRAAAVTAIMMRKQTAIAEKKEVKEVYLDRPFAFLIYDSQNDQIVFAGKVVDCR